MSGISSVAASQSIYVAYPYTAETAIVAAAGTKLDLKATPAARSSQPLSAVIRPLRTLIARSTQLAGLCKRDLNFCLFISVIEGTFRMFFPYSRCVTNLSQLVAISLLASNCQLK